jgi:hypothetical protein
MLVKTPGRIPPAILFGWSHGHTPLYRSVPTDRCVGGRESESTEKISDFGYTESLLLVSDEDRLVVCLLNGKRRERREHFDRGVCVLFVPRKLEERRREEHGFYSQEHLAPRKRHLP